jgi:hypothetical protein
MANPEGRAALAWLREVIDESDANETHAVIVTDPETGKRHIIGPFRTRLEARVAIPLLKARNEKADPEFGNLQYEPVIFFRPPWEEES